MSQTSQKALVLDRTNFYVGSVAVLVPIIILLLMDYLNPGSGKAAINVVKNFLTRSMGPFYILMAIGSIVFCAMVSSGKYGNMVLGDADEEPEYKTLPWIAMIFSAGIGAGVLWGGASEWIYYMTTPPLGIQAGTDLAKEYAITYGIFHWGPSAWAMYSVCSVTIAYLYHIKKDPVLKVSTACNGVLGEKANGPLGSVVDICIMVGLVTASATSLGLGTPMVAAGISKITGVANTMTLNLAVLFIVVLIFGVSSARGLKEGMQKLSSLNIYIAIGLLLFVLCFGGFFLTTCKSYVTSVGVIISKFVRMSTYMEPFSKDSNFVSNWTVFYWAWWVAYGPFMGLFFAKISRGRTIRSMVMGTIVFGTMGCSFFFAVFGNYGLGLLETGVFDAPAKLVASGYNSFPVIIEMFSHLPMSYLFIALFCLSATIFMATTFDAASFALAAMTTKELPEDRDPSKKNRLFWAVMLGGIPATVILIGGDLGTIQTSTVIGGFFMCGILIMVALSFYKEMARDKAAGIVRPTR